MPDDLLQRAEGWTQGEADEDLTPATIKLIEELSTKVREQEEALKAISIPDGDIGTHICDSELERCQVIARAALTKPTQEGKALKTDNK